MKRMHNELPPPDMGTAVLVHRCGTKPDPVKALAFTRETRDAIDAFIEDFAEKRVHALAYMDDPDRDLIGELMYMEWVATATANRLDSVIADLEKETKNE